MFVYTVQSERWWFAGPPSKAALSLSDWRAFHLLNPAAHQELPGFSWPGKDPQIRVETMVTSDVTSLFACILPSAQPMLCADTLFWLDQRVMDTGEDVRDLWSFLDGAGHLEAASSLNPEQQHRPVPSF